MSKKKVAVFANAWSPEYVQAVLKGMYKYSDEKDVLIDVFIIYSSPQEPSEDNLGDFNILRLPDLTNYDGAVVLSNSINFQEEKEFIRKKILKAKIPSISLEYELHGISYMGSENYSGMYALAEHLFTDHQIEDMIYISGPQYHNEALERLKAVSDAADEYGVKLDDTNIFYGDWSYYSAVNIVKDYIKDNGRIPRAIMCANDSMAVGLCESLLEQGYKIPEDVIVTGFDGLKAAVNFYPSITTVGRKWDKMGYDSLKMVLEDRIGMDEVKRFVGKSVVEIGESCGCKICNDKNESRLLTTRANGRNKQVGNVTFDINLRIIYGLINRIHTSEEIHDNLSGYLGRDEEKFETDTFSIMLDPAFFHPDQNGVSRLREQGYPDEMEVVVNIYDNQAYPIERIQTRDIVPECLRNRENSKILFFLPLYSRDKSVGYVALKALETQLEEYRLFVWVKHINQYVDLIRQNIQVKALTDRLTVLSTVDGLTGLYNRTGCKDIIIPFFEERIKNEESVAVIMCDVDSMKGINDTFGHLQGDLALCTIANAIKACISSDWYGCRYGGDEFLIVGKCDSRDVMKKINKEIETKVKRDAKDAQLPYELVVSLGGVVINPGDMLDFDRAISIADDKMYLIKSKHKSKKGEEIR